MIVFGRPRFLSKASMYSHRILFRTSTSWFWILQRYLSSCFSSVAALSKIVKSSASLFELSLPPLCQMFFFSFTDALGASTSDVTSFHFPFGFAWSHVSWELCPPLLPAGCCHRVFVVPYQSLLFHLSFFSVTARFRTAVVFLTIDSLCLLWDAHEDERETCALLLSFKRPRLLMLVTIRHCCHCHHHHHH